MRAHARDGVDTTTTILNLSQETFEISDFDGFTSRPMTESNGIIRRKYSQTLSTGPSIAASSIDQMLMGNLTLLTISLLLLLARLINRQRVEKVWKLWLPTVSVGDPAAKRLLPFGSGYFVDRQGEQDRT